MNRSKEDISAASKFEEYRRAANLSQMKIMCNAAMLYADNQLACIQFNFYEWKQWD